ncbi:MAG: MmgE/PrpD family protein [Chloroflexi bacterium]|nr:MmgE/PrpD family protein [Chloroflexota bacterium]
MPVRDQIASFCYDVRFEDLPRDVVEFTRLLITDQIGLTIAGSRAYLKVGDADIAGFFKALGGTPESSLVAEGCKVPSINAALSNTAISFGGFDGLHRSAVHLPCCLIPATVAVAEKQRASGRDLILATVIGAEVIVRVAAALGSSNAYNLGFHPTSLSAPFGCAMAAGKLLGLGRQTLADALSIAAVQAAGSSLWPQEQRASRTVRVQVGRAAQSGVMAALLAQAGVAGTGRIFEDPRGFLAGHSASPDPAKLTEGLGTVYEIPNTTLKRFGAGIYIIPGMEALLEILQENGIRAGDIAHMTYGLPPSVMPLVGGPEYPTSASASVSTRYVLAVTAYKGEEGMLFNRDYRSEANLQDPRHQALFKLIDVVAEPELGKLSLGNWPCVLSVTTKDGREFRKFHDEPAKGEPGNPFTPAEIEARFSKVVAPVLLLQRADRMLEILRQLENVPDVSELAGHMGNNP